MEHSHAVKIALAHIHAWSNHDWHKTKALLTSDVYASVTSTARGRGTSEFSGIDTYMELKVKAASLIEPGSLRVISSMGDERSALVLVAFRIAMSPGGSMVTMVRSCLYLTDENDKIKEERDQFFFLNQETSWQRLYWATIRQSLFLNRLSKTFTNFIVMTLERSSSKSPCAGDAFRAAVQNKNQHRMLGTVPSLLHLRLCQAAFRSLIMT